MSQKTNDLDERLLELAWQRYEAARTLAHASHAAQRAKEAHQRAHDEHQRVVLAYDNLESDLARGVVKPQEPANLRAAS